MFYKAFVLLRVSTDTERAVVKKNYLLKVWFGIPLLTPTKSFIYSLKQ